MWIYQGFFILLKTLEHELLLLPLVKKLWPHLDYLTAREELIWAELETATGYRFELNVLVKV